MFGFFIKTRFIERAISIETDLFCMIWVGSVNELH